MERIARIGESVILYDGSLLNHFRESWFERSSWPAAQVAPGYAGGRGATLFIEHEGQQWVLRHYHRGGQVARFSRDTFIWSGEARNRAFAEWRLLARMAAVGLPAPKPVAARYVRRGLVYRADLITRRIPGVVPLSTRLATGGIGAGVWRKVGSCIARFHAAHVCHADLTAHNLQIDGDDRIFLLDFDRGRIMSGPGDWRARNLGRLHRSLRKISRDGAISFTDRDWEAILAGYREVIPAS